MDAREQRGIIIAATCRLNRNSDGTWRVPSQSGREEAFYVVNLKAKSCTCPDCAEGGFTCKHYYAASIVYKRDVSPDGTVTETKSMTFTQRTVYRQKWSAYNAAQSHEGDYFQSLLADLCSAIPEPARKGGSKGGRPPVPIRDALFICILKVYSTMSARRCHSDLRDAHRRGHVSAEFSFDIAWKYLQNEAVTPILQELITRSSLPLRSVESDFAIDSSGFSTSRFERWFDEKYGVTRRKSEWIKVHLCCGVKTNVVTAAVVGDKYLGDSPQLPELLSKTATNFKLSDVSADKAYLSAYNLQLVELLGGTPYIPFKANSVEGQTPLWDRMFHFFNLKRDEFMAHYHKRSNVESTFSMMKRKFGDSLRSKKDVAMKNEALAKIVCHNLCCLIQEWHELDIDPTDWGMPSPADSNMPAVLQFPSVS